MNADDLLFASVRARYLDSPEDVAADLRHAADHPERLDGVTPYQALAEAGELLAAAGLHSQAVTILRRAVSAAGHDQESAARVSLTAALARTAGTDGASAKSHDPAGAPGPRGPVGARLAAARAAAGSQREAHQASAGRAGPFMFAARAADVVLWWPDPQYQRLMRQLPEAAPALGWPWPQHIASTERMLRSITRTGRGTGRLIPGEFGQFVAYLKQTATDPCAADSLRRYTAHAAAAGAPAAWPPRPRKPCWCGSGRRYKDCCGIAGPGT